jgi:hypothetical protein
MTIKITLSRTMVQQVVEIGKVRAKNYASQYRKETRQINYKIDIEGDITADEFLARQVLYVATEMAVCVWSGIPGAVPSNENRKDKADVGANIEVKYNTNGPDLFIDDTDRPADVAILTKGEWPTFELMGWAKVADVQQAQYAFMRPGTYRMLASELKPMDHLEVKGDTAYERLHTL